MALRYSTLSVSRALSVLKLQGSVRWIRSTAPCNEDKGDGNDPERPSATRQAISELRGKLEKRMERRQEREGAQHAPESEIVPSMRLRLRYLSVAATCIKHPLAVQEPV